MTISEWKIKCDVGNKNDEEKKTKHECDCVKQFQNGILFSTYERIDQ